MIFVTVGAQMPFDRLIKAVDDWALLRDRADVLAQIGQSGSEPRRIQWRRFFAPHEFRQKVREADVVVAHAGTGSIITALQAGKPILVFPRSASLRETRNDHQTATATHFSRFGGVHVAWDREELFRQLDTSPKWVHTDPIGRCASPELIAAIRDFLARVGPSCR